MNTKNISIFAASLVLLAACTTGPEVQTTVESNEEEVVMEVSNSEVLMVDLEGSEVKWYGEKLVGNGHGGTVMLNEGELMRDGENFVGGNFVIDMTTITSDEGLTGLEDHLKNEDFFEVETYPEATFEITEIEQDGTLQEGTHMVSGNLEIKGISRNISFPATVVESETAYEMTAKFVIDRTEWDVRFGSGKFFDDLGDNVISDEMQFEVKLLANK